MRRTYSRNSAFHQGELTKPQELVSERDDAGQDSVESLRSGRENGIWDIASFNGLAVAPLTCFTFCRSNYNVV